MLVIGLLSSEEEAMELQFIAKVCTVEDRIRHVARLGKLKKLASEEYQRGVNY